MKTANGILAAALAAAGTTVCAAAFGMDAGAQPRALTVERLAEACGIDAAKPRFGWKQGAEHGAAGVTQSAWRVIVSSSRARLDAGDGDMWDSGKVPGAGAIDVEYGGRPLASSRRYWWKVRTWDGNGAESAWSGPASFVTGVMPPGGWKAKWIGPAPETRPDADMGGARWVTAKPDAKGNVAFTRVFDFAGAKPGECVELLHAASTEHEILFNGVQFHRHSGQVGRWDWLRFRDATPWLKPGKNEMKVVVKKGGRGAPQAFICAFRFPGGRRLVTDASWGRDLGGVRDTPYGKSLHLREETASPAFEKTFSVAKPVSSAFLHVTGVGFYEASLDGRKIGDKVLDPSPTAYDKRVLYSTYDLGGALKQGAHTLKVLVGHGWYDVRSIATWNFDVAPWRDFPRMIAQLEIEYADGTRETVVSDGSWRQVESHVGYDCIREGEVIGARHRKHPDFAAKEIHAAEVPAPKGRLVAENCPGAKVMRTIAPKAIHAFPDGTYVVEFPENFAGWIRMDVRGQEKGDVLAIRYDERVNKDFSPARPSSCNGLENSAPAYAVQNGKSGSEPRRIDCHYRYTASQAVCPVGAAFQADRFVSSGAAVERYEPRFTYNGFQYVVLKGLRKPPRKEDITGCVVHTDFPAIGSFECSDDTFNKLMSMGDRAYRSNFADGYPTDCPHREKNGWTGDASIASELAQYCYENTAAYEKWLYDILDSQRPHGEIPGIVPTGGWGFSWGNGPAWDSAFPVVAWNLWCYRGDRRILDAVYPALKRYVDYTSRKARRNLVRHGIGDWNHVDRRHVPSVEFTSSCYYRQAAAILSRIAAIKGLADDAARYGGLADAVKNAINAKYRKGRGVYDNGRQTAQAFALAFGLPPENERAAVAAKLVESVEREGCHVDIGLLGSKHVFRALSRAGRTDLAFKMLVNPTKPSPVEWIKKGGTALWEDWGDGTSRNHIMFGDFMAWAYQYLAGIRLAEKEGSCAAFYDASAEAFREIVIEPQFIDALEWVRASVDGPNGKMSVSWRRDGGKVTLEATVPPNTIATVRLPGEPDRRVGSGTYTFTATVRGAMLDLQPQIDAAAAKGGGTVRVPQGEHVAKPFVLKSNVTLELADGAKLLASTNIADYAARGGCPAFIYAEHATNVAIVGKGVIDGRGGGFREKAKLRGEDQPKTLPLLMRFSRCRNVRLEGFRYTNPGAWACHLRNCDGVTMKGASCFNYCNKMNDGIDIESCNVTIEDCDFCADDDALCFKSESDRSFPVTNVTVRNCRMASICNAIKFGTGSYGDFRDITIENCELRRTPAAWRWNWSRSIPGVTNRLCGIAGLALEVVDGGRMENVTVRNISIEGYATPIFIRHHHRHEPKGGMVNTYLRNILIENVNGSADGRIASSITGVPARGGAGPRRPRNITLRNISLAVPGGGTAAEAKAKVPEKDGAYPEAFMFDRMALPAYGFYVRHADGVVFDNVVVTPRAPDARPAFVAEDCRPEIKPPAKPEGNGTADAMSQSVPGTKSRM